MTTSAVPDPAHHLWQALQQGRVILLLGRDAGLEAMVVTFVSSFDLRVALLAGRHGPLQEGLARIGRPIHRLGLAEVGELDPDAVYLIELGSLRNFRRQVQAGASPFPAVLLALFRTHSVLVLGMKPDDPWLEALVSLWPEGR
ncbi:MAG: hypothetical protein RMN24_14220, partial [Anaerolineae bacterium]|nr:hypothetical protein [Caldilineales bacterium]MDW8270312.1 hypothetical protein [Anaerolineae bacterium]